MPTNSASFSSAFFASAASLSLISGALGAHDLQMVVSEGILALHPRQLVVVVDCLKKEVMPFFSGPKAKGRDDEIEDGDGEGEGEGKEIE